MLTTQLRVPDFDLELISGDNATVLLDTVDVPKRPISEVIRDPATPLLVMTGTLYQEVRYLAEQHPNCEWGIFLTMKRASSRNPIWLAFDFFMPKQTATAAHVTLDGDDCRAHYEALKAVCPYYVEHGLHKNLCHLHSHNSLSLSGFSGVDVAQQTGRDDLGFFDEYRFYVVVTTQGTVKADLMVYSPVMVRVPAYVAVTYCRPEYAVELTRARKTELDALYTANVSTPAPVYKGALGNTSAFGHQNSLYYDRYGFDHVWGALQDGVTTKSFDGDDHRAMPNTFSEFVEFVGDELFEFGEGIRDPDSVEVKRLVERLEAAYREPLSENARVVSCAHIVQYITNKTTVGVGVPEGVRVAAPELAADVLCDMYDAYMGDTVGIDPHSSISEACAFSLSGLEAFDTAALGDLVRDEFSRIFR